VSKSKLVYLSYKLDENTPTYGDRNKFVCEKRSDILNGDVTNDTNINTTVHIGTHIDMPYHFYENGQTIKDFTIDYFRFNNILYIDMVPKDIIVKDDLIKILEDKLDKNKYDLLIVKTGICHKRDKKEFWQTNYGFDPSIAKYLRDNFPNIRVIGFDSVSVSSFSNRMLGRESHKAFLNPKNPILILEDMDLTMLKQDSIITKLDIVPLRISNCDGLPCTILAEVE
jgi:kynurenine formamidase